MLEDVPLPILFSIHLPISLKYVSSLCKPADVIYFNKLWQQIPEFHYWFYKNVNNLFKIDLFLFQTDISLLLPPNSSI